MVHFALRDSLYWLHTTLIEISEHMNFMKIFHIPFFVDYLSLVCHAAPIFLLMWRARSGEPCKYLEHVRKMHRKLSRSLWKKFQFTKLNELDFIRIFQHYFEHKFFQISTAFTFPHMWFDWCVVRSRYFYWRKNLCQADLGDILNIFVKSTEKFLGAFEKKSAQKMRKKWHSK